MRMVKFLLEKAIELETMVLVIPIEDIQMHHLPFDVLITNGNCDLCKHGNLVRICENLHVRKLLINYLHM